jgi:hypothetical protein
MRHGYWIVVGVLSTAIGLMIGFMVINIAVPELGLSGIIGGPGRPAPSDERAASPASNTEVKMGGAILPGDAQCAGCHLTSDGGIGLRAMPVMGHPLEGWSQCTSCHAPDRLVETAPGHSGIHASECTVCHKAGNLPVPLSRPHRDNQNVACLSCHGSIAPLPSDMAHRKEAVCWLCHRLPVVEPPVPAHLTAPGEADCLTCHVAGGRAGGLPTDHVERPSSLCLSCHEVALGATPGNSPRITTWPAPSNTP